MSPEKPVKTGSRRRKIVLVVAQAAVSVAVLVWIAQHVGFSESSESIRRIPTQAVLIATAIVGVAFIGNGFRWGMILRGLSIVLSWGQYVAGTNMMGLFLSLFLPTGVGGDAFRIDAVAGKSRQPAAAVLGTMQERLLGLCGALLASLGAMSLAGHILPGQLWPSVLSVQVASLAGLVVVLRPRLLLVLSKPLVRMLERLGKVAPRMHSANGRRRSALSWPTWRR